MSATRAPQPTGHGLVLPADGGDERSALAHAYRSYLVQCVDRLLAARDHLPVSLRASHERICALVRDSFRRDQRSTLHCFASPSVGIPLHCMASVPKGTARELDEAIAAMMPHLLLEMSLRGLLPEGTAVAWDHGAPPLTSMAVSGEILPPTGAAGLRFSSDQLGAIAGGDEIASLSWNRPSMAAALRSDERGFRIERCFWSIRGVTHFATRDRNPIAAFETHPEKHGNHVDLGGRAAADWVAVLEQCLELIGGFLPNELAEMKVMLQQIVPVGFDREKHLSASYREAVGTIYSTLHPSVMVMTEALIHEFQHNKLNVASYRVEYLENAFEPLYRSPVRPDPRPLWGILLAVHAFLPVAELYRRMRATGHELTTHPDFGARLADLDQKNHEGMEMLRAHAQLTGAGQALFAELEELERRHLADSAQRPA